MHHHRQPAWKSWILMGAGGSGLALTALFGACSIGAGNSSEIESYDLAVRTQNVAASRAFLEQYRSSHLVGDLIESLPPDVALQVCGDLPAGTASKAARACDQLRGTLAKGSAPAGTIQLAAAAPMVVPTGVAPTVAAPTATAPTGASDCVARPVVLSADPTPADATPRTKTKRSAGAPAKAKATPAPRLLQIASVGRGNKEVRR